MTRVRFNIGPTHPDDIWYILTFHGFQLPGKSRIHQVVNYKNSEFDETIKWGKEHCGLPSAQGKVLVIAYGIKLSDSREICETRVHCLRWSFRQSDCSFTKIRSGIALTLWIIQYRGQ